MRIVLVLSLCFAHNVIWAQEQGQPPAKSGLSYNFVELRYVDTDDNGGDGFELNGSFNVSGNWPGKKAEPYTVRFQQMDRKLYCSSASRQGRGGGRWIIFSAFSSSTTAGSDAKGLPHSIS